MKKYQIRTYPGYALHDIPNDVCENSILDFIKDCENEVLTQYLIPKYLIMNPMAYSMFCSSISSNKKSKKIVCPKEYREMQIVVVPTQGHENNKYQPDVRVVSEPSEINLFRSLNQEQFYKKKKK